MSRLHVFVQKRQLLILLLPVLCALSGCTASQRVEPSSAIAPSCLQQCGTSTNEKTFACIDRCHLMGTHAPSL
jgi:hypothetical protein